jgi:hypothetical protein
MNQDSAMSLTHETSKNNIRHPRQQQADDVNNF